MSETRVVNTAIRMSNVFTEAANTIEERGWWNGERFPEGGNPACLWTAVLSAAESTHLDMGVRTIRALVAPVFAHFGFRPYDDRMQALYDLNDAQPAATGKAWAISHLREIAQEVLEP